MISEVVACLLACSSASSANIGSKNIYQNNCSSVASSQVGASADNDFYSSVDFPLTSLSAFVSSNTYSLVYCLRPIPSLQTAYPSFSYGNWTIVSFEQAENECAQVACLDLAYSYKFSSILDLTGGNAWTTNLQLLEYYQSYSPTQGTTESNMVSGFSQWCGGNYCLSSCTNNYTAPTIALYCDPYGAKHMALKIGELIASGSVHHDIVVSKVKNFYGITNPTIITSSFEGCFFTIPSSQRISNYALSAS